MAMGEAQETTVRRPAQPPSPWLTALEVRAPFEMASGRLAGPLLRRSHRGDGHPVLVLPGFTADDRSTVPLRRNIREQGYHTHGWRLGRNLGPTPDIVEGLAERLVAVHGREGRAVSLIGWSLGGIYARELARMAPEKVRQVITLGSPFRMTDQDRSAASRFYEQMAPLHAGDVEPRLPESIRPPLEVPSTAVYTRTDGIVRWFHCLEADGPRRENIEVLGSHCGLGHNPAVIHAVSDRLARPAADWQPFRPPRWARRAYPRPESWRDQRRPVGV